MGRKPKVRIQEVPNLVHPGMDLQSLVRALQQNFDHISGQQRAMARALADLLDEPDDVEPVPVDSGTVTVVFRRVKRRRRVQYNCVARFTGVESEDETIVRYIGQLLYTDVNGVPVEYDTDGNVIIHRASMDVPDVGDAGDTYKLVWRNLLRPRRWYVMLRIRPVGRQGFRGPWTPWTAPLLPFNVANKIPPSPVSSVTASNPTPRRVVFQWPEPPLTDDEATVDHYRVEVYRNDGGVWTLVDTARTKSPRHVHRVPKADRGKQFRARVFVVDEDDIESTGVDSGTQADNETWDGSADLAPGSINSLTPFASTIRPVALVSSLPGLPNATYPPGSYVYNTTNRRLFENKNDVWVDAVSAGNLSGQIHGASQIVFDSITGGQIAAGAISASELAAGAVTADKINVSSLSAISVNAGTLTAGTIEGLVIRTGTTGNFISMKDADAGDRVVFRSNAGNPALVAGSGVITLSGGRLNFGSSGLQTNGGLHLANAGGDLPAPSAGVVLYAKSGRLYYRSATGTVYGPL